jgi:hypothetical protein
MAMDALERRGDPPQEKTKGGEPKRELSHELMIKILSVCGIVIFALGALLVIAGEVVRSVVSPYRMDHLDYIEPTWEPVTEDPAAVH